MAFAAQTVQAATYYVATNGNNANEGSQSAASRKLWKLS